ncbi:hypothetical protein ACFL2F_00380 [Myxococcota bacterium]
MIDSMMEDPVIRVLMMRYEFWFVLLLLPLLVDSFTGKRKLILLWLRGVVGALVFLWGVYMAGATIWTSVRLAPEIAGTAGPFLVFWILLSLSTASWFIYLGWPNAVAVLGGDGSRIQAREGRVEAHRAWFLRITLALFLGWPFYALLILGSHILIMYLSNYGLVVIGSYALARVIVEVPFRGYTGRRMPAILSSAVGAAALCTGLFGLVYLAYKLAGGPGWTLRSFDPFVWPALLGLGFLLFRYTGGVGARRTLRLAVVQVALGIVAVGLFIWIRVDCKARVGDLEQWLADLVSDSRRAGSTWLDPHFKVDLVKPKADKLQHVILPKESERCMRIRSDALRIEWESYPVGDNPNRDLYEVEYYAHQLDEFHNKGSFDKLRNDLALYVDRDAPWHLLVRVVSAMTRDKDRKLAFVFQAQKPRRLPSPPLSSLTSAYKEIDRKRGQDNLKLPYYFKLFEECVIRRCPPLVKLYSGTSTMSQMGRLEYDAKRLPAAITHCCCDIDMDVLKTFVWHFGDFGEPVDLFQLHVTNPGNEKAKSITLPGEIPWSKAYEHVVLAAKDNLPVRFVVAGWGTLIID